MESSPAFNVSVSLIPTQEDSAAEAILFVLSETERRKLEKAKISLKLAT